jgi:hypothetical protein
MGQYDITLRHLIQTGGHAFLRAVGGEGRLTLLQTDFPSTRDRRVDFLAVHDSHDGFQQLLHIEFQSTPDSTMAARMLGYYSDIQAWLRFHARRDDHIGALPREIVQKVVYVGAAKWDPETEIRHRNLKFRFDYIDVRELATKPLLATGDLGDAAIAVLTADGTSPDVIKAILNKIARTPGSDRADALAQLIALSELRGIRQLIEQEYSTMPINLSVENSTILRPPIDRAYDLGLAKGKAEGEAIGKAEGEAKGKAEGHAHGIAEAIATILDQRFPGQVPAGLSDRLSAVSTEALDEILHKCLTATSVKDALGNYEPLNGSQSKA